MNSYLFAVIIIVSSLLPYIVLYRFKKFILFEIFALIAIGLQGVYLFGFEILYLLVITYIISTIAELISLKTSFNCFGVKYCYNLNNRFFSSKINLLGVYPLEISFAWVILKYISFTLGIIISSAFSLSEITKILLIPLILVSLDFLIDPISVNQKKLWSWEKGSSYFGIPLRNFLGWYLVGLVTSIFFTFTTRSGNISFSFFYILPLISYASFLRNIPLMYKQNKLTAILGSIPVAIWVVLSAVSLFLI